MLKKKGNEGKFTKTNKLKLIFADKNFWFFQTKKIAYYCVLLNWGMIMKLLTDEVLPLQKITL